MAVVYQERHEQLMAKITENNNYPAHIHRQTEVFYVIEGSINITVGSRTQALTKGMLSIAFPNIIHRTSTADYSSAIMLIFDTDMLHDFYHEFTHMLPEEPFITNPSITASFRTDIMNLLECEQESGDIRMSKGYLYIFLSKLLNSMTLIPHEHSKSDICQEIAVYLNTHYTEHISLTDLSASLGYSKYHVSHVFNEKFGCSFSDYLNRLRAEHAMGLLTHSSISVTDACFASGFNSTRTFYRVFENVYGASPKELQSGLKNSN